MQVYATVEDIAQRWGHDIPEERRAYVQSQIDAAHVRIRAKLPIDGRVTRGEVSPETVRVVIEDMVLRVLRNPSGARTQQAGEFSITLDRSLSSGALTLTEEELELLGEGDGAYSVGVRDETLPQVTRVPPWWGGDEAWISQTEPW